jgi:hypothetical protein
MRFLSRAIQPLLHSGLQVLDLSRCGLLSSGACALGAAFQPVYTYPTLSESDETGELSAEGGSLLHPLARAATNAGSHLRELNLDANNITEFESTIAGTIALTEGLHFLPVLECLHLSHNRLSGTAVRYLAEYVSDSRSLRELWLNENGIDSAGAKLLAVAIRTGGILEQLHVRGNQIASDGAAEFARCFGSKLRVLDLRKNLLTAWGRLELVRALRPDDPCVVAALKQQAGTEQNKPLKFMSTPRLSQSITNKPAALSGVGSSEATESVHSPEVEDGYGQHDVYSEEAADFISAQSADSVAHAQVPALALGGVTTTQHLPATIARAISPPAVDDAQPHHLSGELTPRGGSTPEGMFEDGGHLFFRVHSADGCKAVMF